MATLAVRAAAHRRRSEALREAKRLRVARADTHAAMAKATRMKRSRKKGTSDREVNMERLGFHRIAPNGLVDGRRLDVLNKFHRHDPVHEFALEMVAP